MLIVMATNYKAPWNKSNKSKTCARSLWRNQKASVIYIKGTVGQRDEDAHDQRQLFQGLLQPMSTSHLSALASSGLRV